MASLFATSNAFKYILFATLFATALVSGFQFDIGGKHRGWKKPVGNEPETYNEWAVKNRFHIGDSVYFKYKNDSVLVVTAPDYLNCNTANPIAKFEDGSTVFTFDRSGFFYFISGASDHCKSGQKLDIRVMHPLEEVAGPTLAPTPGGGGSGGDSSSEWGPPSANSTTKLFLVSYFMTAFAGLFVVVVYLFM